MVRVITFGTFDLFHIGHLKILEKAKQLGDTLIVGVSSDALTYTKKNKYPVISEKERMEIIKAIRYVDTVFLEESLSKKKEYVKIYQADVLVMGDDWTGKFDGMAKSVIYLPRTIGVSTTDIIKSINS